MLTGVYILQQNLLCCFRLYLCEKLITNENSIVLLWPHLLNCHKYVLFLELFYYENIYFSIPVSQDCFQTFLCYKMHESYNSNNIVLFVLSLVSSIFITGNECSSRFFCVCLCVYLPTCLSACLPICLPVCLCLSGQ